MTDLLKAIVLVVSLSMPAVVACGAEPRAGGSPSGIVRRIYTDHQPWAGKEIKWWERGTLAEYFEPSLVALVEKDAEDAEKRGEVGCLDGDPFLDAQDWDEAGITTPRIVETPTKEGARVEVSFTGRSEAWKAWNVTLTYDVRRTANGWRVYDVVYRDGHSLRSIVDCMSAESGK